MIEKIKNIFKYIFYWIVLLIIILIVYFLSSLTGSELTTAKSCSGSYIMGEMDIKGVKESCPNLTKQSLIEQVNEHFDKFGDKNAFTKKEKMLEDINTNF